MNFGVKVTIGYLSFVALILTLVFKSFGEKVELVSKDYYAQELKFQDKIDAINNEKSLNKSISHSITGKQITLVADSALMSSDFSGDVNFFRPSNSDLDVKLKMNFVNGQQVIDAKDLVHGTYKMQLSWVCNGKHYFKEEVIFIN